VRWPGIAPRRWAVVRYMTRKLILQPGPDHPITVEPNPDHVVVTRHGRLIADSRNALLLQEASYPAVHYIPRADVDPSALRRTDHETYCPYKGEASYFSIVVGEEPAENAGWTYEAPYAAVGEIKDHVAFYPDQVEIRVETAA
jgi:uncharacterized protein (DUF427 family)